MQIPIETICCPLSFDALQESKFFLFYSTIIVDDINPLVTDTLYLVAIW